jgi:hypothetical protein
MGEVTVFRIGAVYFQPDLQAAGGKVAFGGDVVSGEKVNDGSGNGDKLADTKAAVGIERGGAGAFDVRAADPTTARDVVQQFSLCRSGGFFELLPRLNGDFDAFLPSG